MYTASSELYGVLLMRYLLTVLIFLISFPAYADSIYLRMPITPDNPVYSFEDFKVRYLELTGENIQQSPLTNTQETHYMTGSSRLTQAIADQLDSEFPMVIISNKGVWPVGWVTKDPPE